jgi:calmodulin
MEELRMAFDMFDEAADGNGALLKSHIKGICEKYGAKMTSQEADDMFKEADSSKTGKIAFPEFVNMMANRMKMVFDFDFIFQFLLFYRIKFFVQIF